MKPFKFSEKKNKLLKATRSIDFLIIIKAINENKVIKILNHPNKKKFPKQKIILINLNKYVYAVPFVETKEKIYLKTIYRSRKYTKKYLRN